MYQNMKSTRQRDETNRDGRFSRVTIANRSLLRIDQEVSNLFGHSQATGFVEVITREPSTKSAPRRVFDEVLAAKELSPENIL